MSVITEQEKQTLPPTPAPKPPRRGIFRIIILLILVVSLVGLALWAALSGKSGGADNALNTTPTPATGRTNLIPALANTQLFTDLVGDPKDPNALFLASSGGVQRSSDGGKSWQAVNDGLGGARVLSLTIDGDDLQRSIYAATDGKGLFRSADGGKSWQNLGLGNRKLVKVIARNGLIFVAVNGPLNGVYRSPDAGKSWFVSSNRSLPPTAQIRNLVLDPTNPQLLYMTTAYVPNLKAEDWSRVKFSQDGGTTWNELGRWSADLTLPNSKGELNVLLAATGSRVYAGDGDILYRVTPDRLGWLHAGGGLPDKGVYGIAPDPQRPGVIYAATVSGFYRNSDGLRWIKLADGEQLSPLATNTKLTALPTLITINAQNKAIETGLSSTILYALNSEGRLARYENRDFGSGVYANILNKGVIVADFSLYGGVNPAARVTPPDAGSTDPNRQYFNETGHYLAGGFKNYWTQNNGLKVFGYPVTEEFSEFDPQTNLRRTVQYFERAKLEYLPNQLPGNEIQVALLGKESLLGQYIVPGRFVPTDSTIRFFDVTQHTLKGEFKNYWERNGGLLRFGYPLTEEQEEKTPAGKTIVVQYFERLKLQFIDGQVQIALLGVEVLQSRGWLSK